jgi:anti-anti-sigma regulatory factor
MLKISIVEGRKQRRLVVEGKLVAPWSDELKAACERGGSGLNGRELVVDLKNLTTISQQGENLLLELMKQGVRLRGSGVYTNEILKQLARRLRRNGAHE